MIPYDPSINGLMNWQRLSQNADEAHDAYEQQLHDDHLHAMMSGGGDPFYEMKLTQSAATRPLMDQWSPFREALSESGAKRVSFGGSSDRDAMDDAKNADAALAQMPFTATAASYPTSVQRLFKSGKLLPPGPSGRIFPSGG